MINTCKEILSLMCDMAQESVERARIKAQQNRIAEIVRIDKRELDRIYSKIGRIDVLGGDKDEREELCAEAKKIEARILRAQIRYDKLKVSASVDMCTKAFEEKLTDTVKSVQQAASDKAKDVAESAREKGADIAEKIKAASADISAKAEDITIKAKDKAADLTVKARDKADDIAAKAKSKAADISAKAKDKAENLTDKAKEKLPKSAPEKMAQTLEADEKVLDNVDDILKRIEDTINSVDEESADEFKF